MTLNNLQSEKKLSAKKIALASVIGILVFLVVAGISLVVYNVLPSIKNEEDFQ